MPQRKAEVSEPGFGAVVAVLVAELGFEYAGLGAGAHYLHGDDECEDRERGIEVGVEQHAEDAEESEDVDRIADLRVGAGGDESASFGRYGKSVAELVARDGEEREEDESEGEAGDARGVPAGFGGGVVDEHAD